MATVTIGNLVVRLLGDTKKFVAAMKGAERRIEATSAKFRSAGASMTKALTVPLALIGVASVKAFADFDAAMTKSTAIMGNVSAELRAEMEATARSISRNSVSSAKDLAEAYFFLASAGLSAEQSIATLSTVQQFAAAGAFDLAKATDLLTDAQSALGLSRDALGNVLDTKQLTKNMKRVSDVLLKANTLANATAEQFSKALVTKAGASLKLLNKSVEEGAAVLAVFADKGIKGELAGEKLSIVLRDLQSASIKQPEIWKKLGLNVFDTAGKMLPMADIVQQLTTAFGKMSDRQKKSAATMLGFQDRSFAALQTLFGTSKQIRNYQKALESAGGTTEKVANNQMRSFSSQLTILKNRLMDVAIGIGRTLAPLIAQLANRLDVVVQAWNSLSKSTQKFIVLTAVLVGLVGPALLGVAAIVAIIGSAIGGIAALVGGAIAAVTALGSAFVAVAAAAAAMSAPLIIAIAAVTVGVVALTAHLIGNGSMAAAWNTLKSAAFSFAKATVGFLFNLKDNMKVILQWLRDNWFLLFVDLAAAVGTFVRNMAFNIGTVIVTIFNLFVGLGKSLAKIFTKIFEGDFLETMSSALKKAADKMFGWALDIAIIVGNVFRGNFKKAGKQMDKLIGDIAKSGRKAAKAISESEMFKSAAKIVKAGAAKARTPLEGFKPSVRGPKLNFEIPKKVMDVINDLRNAWLFVSLL